MFTMRFLGASALTLAALSAPAVAGASPNDHHALDEHQQELDHRRSELELRGMEQELELRHRELELQQRARMEKLDRYERELDLQQHRWELEHRERELRLQERELDLNELEIELRYRERELEEAWLELEEDHGWHEDHDEDHDGWHEDHGEHHDRDHDRDHDEDHGWHEGHDEDHRWREHHDEDEDHDERRRRRDDGERQERDRMDFSELETRLEVLAGVADMYERAGRDGEANELWPLVEAGELYLEEASPEEVAEAYEGGADLQRRIELLRDAASHLREVDEDEPARYVAGLARFYRERGAQAGEQARAQQPREARRLDLSELGVRIRLIAGAAKLHDAMGWETATAELRSLVEAGELQLRGASEAEVNAAYEGAADLAQRVEHLRRAAGWMKERGDDERAAMYGGLARYYHRMRIESEGGDQLRRAR